MMYFRRWVPLLLILTGCWTGSIEAHAQTTTWTVVSITDGDTIRAKQPGGRSVRIRLACIDAPEKKQPLGLSSRDALQALVPIGSVVTLNVTDIDRYDRPVAEIYNGSVLVQLQMVRSGMAYVYEKYLKNCPLSAKSLMEAEDQARRIRMGVWSDPSAIKPWDFRKSNR